MAIPNPHSSMAKKSTAARGALKRVVGTVDLFVDRAICLSCLGQERRGVDAGNKYGKSLVNSRVVTRKNICGSYSSYSMQGDPLRELPKHDLNTYDVTVREKQAEAVS